MSRTNRVTSSQQDTLSSTDDRTLEQRIADQEASLQALRAETHRLRQELDSLRAAVEQVTTQNVATCKKCGARYDVFAHHYSIGLFDNIVYVKCPQCQTAMPVDPRLGVRPE